MPVGPSPGLFDQHSESMPPPKSQNADDDDWETDPDFVNNQTEEEQRRGGAAKKDAGTVDMQEIKDSVLRQEAEKSKAKYVSLP